MLLDALRRLDLPRADDLSRRYLYHLITAYVLICLPMLTMFPVWIILIAILTVGLKMTAIRRHWQLSKWWVFPIAVLSVIMVVSNAQRIGLENFSVASLFVFASLKLLEAREERDAFMLMLINLLLMVGSLMAHNNPFVFAYIIFCFFYNLYIQMRIAQPVNLAISWRQNTKTLVKIFLISLPFVIGLFFFFPRINPLWQQPVLSQNRTGLSDEMTPNSLSELTLDGGLAFRVKFKGEIPENEQLYWRGPVLSEFDGKTWRRDAKKDKQKRQPIEPIKVIGDTSFDYTVYHDGQTQQWVVPLELPTKKPEKTELNANYEMSMTEQGKPQAFALTSYPNYRTPKLSDEEHRYNRLLPVDIFPKTRELANSMAKESYTVEEFAKKVLAYFRENAFYYDLAAPVGNSDMDTFLFTNRSGYCEHYASTFTFMMRSQGVPARVVIGYQGGAINSVSEEMEVGQYNAHAWSEVYIDGKGWVRYDPTAEIAPERVRYGSPFGSVRNSSMISSGARWENQSEWFKAISVRFRAMQAFWQNWIIGYDSDKQKSLWQRLGLSEWKNVLWIIFIVALLPITFIVILVYRYYRRKNQGDAIYKAMQPFIKILKKAGFEKPKGQAWQNFIAEQELSAAKPYAERVIDCYYRLRYESMDSDSDDYKTDMQNLKVAIHLFKKKFS